MKKLFDPKLTKEAWILFFLLGIIMINYPFIHIFNKTTLVFGIPVLILYFFIGWPISILVTFCFCRFLRPEPPEEDRDTKKGEDLE